MRQTLSRHTLHHRSQPHTLLQFVTEFEGVFLTFGHWQFFRFILDIVSCIYISIYGNSTQFFDTGDYGFKKIIVITLLEGDLTTTLSIDTRRFFKVV